MATIVEYTETRDRYILLGAGYGMWAKSRPSRVMPGWMVNEEDGMEEMLCVCNGAGQIDWFPASRLRVVEIDGVGPAEALN